MLLWLRFTTKRSLVPVWNVSKPLHWKKINKGSQMGHIQIYFFYLKLNVKIKLIYKIRKLYLQQ